MVLEIITKTATASWDILLESSGFILFGFFVAGLLKAFVPGDLVARHLGKGRFSGIVKASAFGIPLPLCSCGVLPAAAGLKEQGAGKGATASFLISTPETGVDSIAVSWALLDPVMTIIRPVSAFFTAIITGVLVTLFDRDPKPVPPSPFQMAPQGCSDGCGCHDSENAPSGFIDKLKSGMRFAFGELFDDISRWLIFGIILAGVITAFLPPEIISNWFGDGFLPMVAVLVIAVPLYICATASTPIAAALALKGLSPGAALVFLLAGPATNAAALTVISKILGKKMTAIYLFSIVAVSLLLGVITNKIYFMLGLDITSWVASGDHSGHGPIAIGFAVIMILMMLSGFIRKKAK